jgi:hypothetical protein
MGGSGTHASGLLCALGFSLTGFSLHPGTVVPNRKAFRNAQRIPFSCLSIGQGPRLLFGRSHPEPRTALDPYPEFSWSSVLPRKGSSKARAWSPFLPAASPPLPGAACSNSLRRVAIIITHRVRKRGNRLFILQKRQILPDSLRISALAPRKTMETHGFGGLGKFYLFLNRSF